MSKGIHQLTLESSPNAKSSIVIHREPLPNDGCELPVHVEENEMSKLVNEMSNLDIDANLSVIEKNVLKALLIQLPHYIKSSLESVVGVSDCTSQQLHALQQDIQSHGAQLKKQGEQIKKLQGQLKHILDNQKEAVNKMSGHKKTNNWVEKVKSIQGQVNTLNLDFAKYNKENNNRANEYHKLQQKVKTQLEGVKNIKEDYKKQLQEFENIDPKKFKAIESSQKFISEKYDEVNNHVKKVAEQLAVEKSKSEHHAVYSRIDSLEVAGVPAMKDEHCKTIVENVCKELHYNIRDGAISTAHRLKPRRDGGPPAIIVRFNNRDVRNDVYKLKSLLKEKREWKCYNIDKLYINECLTPEKRNHLYKTKKKTPGIFYPKIKKKMFGHIKGACLDA